MVRLVGYLIDGIAGHTKVSIPIWCDWWGFSVNHAYFAMMFQFLYGAIGGSAEEFKYFLIVSFNSYMVRLVVCSIQARTCSLSAFQFLYGAIGGWILIIQLAKYGSFNSYMVRLVARSSMLSANRCVSIPIWCDWWFSCV